MPRRAATSSPRSARPKVIRELVKVGLVRDQTEWMLDILEDPARTGVVDGHDAGGDAGHRDDRPARRGWSRDRGRQPSALVANRVLPALFDARSRPRCSTGARRGARTCSSRRPGAASPPVLDRGRRSPRPAGRSATATSNGCASRLGRAADARTCPSCSREATGRRVVALVAEHSPTSCKLGGRADGAHGGAVRDGRSDARCSRPRRWCSSAGRAASARRRWRRRWRRRPRREIGGRVLVLTVDPARRLADALGVGALGNEARLVPG